MTTQGESHGADAPTWTTVDWARYYASVGLVTLPLARLGNRPHDGLVGRGWHFCTCTGGDADVPGSLVGSSDPATLARWFDADPRANLGVVLGARSRLLVLDVDVKHVDGHAALRRWRLDHEAEGKTLPPHPSCTSPSGGRHHWFRLPTGLHVARNDYFVPGVEVKACGGLVAVPPSRRVTTVTTLDAETGTLLTDEALASYSWDGVGVSVPDAPAWLLEDVATRREGAAWTAAGSGAAADDKLPPTGEFLKRGFWRDGARNRDCFRLACRLWTELGRREDVLNVIRRVWEVTPTRRTFPWSEAEYTALQAGGRMARARAEERARVERYLATRGARRGGGR